MPMARSPVDFANLVSRLDSSGLVCFGGFELSQKECVEEGEALLGRKAILIGNAGPQMWEAFSDSKEYKDNKPDPMNRWTKRVLDLIADEYQAHVIYPFEKPFWPFQKMAEAALGVRPSPLGILIHPEYGLWHAFRGVLVFDSSHGMMNQISALSRQDEKLIHPCDTCVEKPCLTACPVGAFTGEALKVENCFSHLDSHSSPFCMQTGCQSRKACPVGKYFEYSSEQIQFHMKAYRG